MRKFLYILSLAFTGCSSTTQDEKNDDSRLICSNELTLLYSQESNLFIDLDSLKTQSNYLRKILPLLKTKRPKKIIPYTYFTSSELGFDGDEKIKLSFLPLLYQTGAGYMWDNREIFKISQFSQEHIYVSETIMVSIDSLRFRLTNFLYNNRKLQKEFLELNGLEIWLKFPNDSILKHEQLFKTIVHSYLDSQNKISYELFNLDICSLTPKQLDSLKKALPFGVRLFGKPKKWTVK